MLEEANRAHVGETKDRRSNATAQAASRAGSREYVEMPGLRLTPSQACRLWQVDLATCEELFDHLLREGFLSRTGSGFYIASQETRERI